MSQASARLLAGFTVCAMAFVAGCGGAKSRFATHVQRGEQYLNAGTFDKASVEFHNALQIEPHDPHALYLNGVAAEKRGRVREAFGSYQEAVDLKPDYPDARAALGRLLVFNGAADRALPIIEAGVAKHPDDVRLLAVRSAARAQLQNMPGALADAERAVKVAPNDADAVALLAGLYQRQGDPNRAIDLVEATLTRNPKSVDLHQVLAGLYHAIHQDAKSEEQLKGIVALAPNELAHRYALAAFYESSGNMDAAQQVLEQAVKSAPASAQAKLVLVQFIASQRSRPQGEKTLRDFIAREPDNEQLRLGLGTLLQRAGALQDAVTAYNEIVNRDPKSAAAFTARDRIAAIEISRGHTEAAQRLIAAVLEENPRDVDALMMRGNLALNADDPASAITDLRAVLRDQPNALEAQRSLARAYVANGEPALAEETLRAAMQSAPANTAVRIDLAQLLLETRRGDAAVALLEETARAAPTDVDARAALARAYLAEGDLAAAQTAVADLEKLQPNTATGPYLAGLIAERQNRLDDSQREFERALQLQPDALDALRELTRVQLARGQDAAALARARAFVAAHQASPLAANFLGELLIATKSFPEATEQLQRAIQLSPAWSLPYYNLALARVNAQDAGGAIAACQAGLKVAAGDPRLSAELATLYERQGRIEQAIEQYEGMYARHPHLDFAANNLAMLLVTYRTDQRSLDRARSLTAPFANSDSSALLDTHGWVRLKLGDVNDALPALERAADQAPTSKLIRYHLAMAELKAGQRDKARQNLESALSGNARFAGSDDARAALNTLNAGSKG